MNTFFDSKNLAHWSDVAVAEGIHLGIAILILLIGLALCTRLANMGRGAMKRSHVDPILIDFLRNVLFGGLLVVVLIPVLDVAGIPSASFVAALGAAGLAIGLALNSSLSNIAWGVLLIIFRPFRIGDYVTIGAAEGKVESINLMQTMLLAPDNREVIIPNATVGTGMIFNANVRDTRRVELKLAVAYESDIDSVSATILEAVMRSASILSDPAPAVWVGQLGDNAVTLIVRAWAKTNDNWSAKSDLQKTIHAALVKSNVKTVALPTATQ